MLAELNLKLIRVFPHAAGSPAVASAPAVSPSPGGHSVVADEASALGLMGSANASSGLVVTVAEEYDLEDNFHQDGYRIFTSLGLHINHRYYHMPWATRANQKLAEGFCMHNIIHSEAPIGLFEVQKRQTITAKTKRTHDALALRVRNK